MVTTIEQRLSASHAASYNAFALRIWSRFAEAVVAAVDEAGSRLRDVDRVRCYSSLQGWWRRSEHRNPSGVMVKAPAEDAITHALVVELERLRNDSRKGDPLFDLNIAFVEQQPRRNQKRIGPDALTTDIRAFVPDVRGLDMRIEAKVLRHRSDLIAEYLGPRGMLRFADDDNPYADTPVGAMLAYVVAPIDPDFTEALVTDLSRTDQALLIDRLTIGETLLPACDLVRADGRVTVLHMSQIHETSPSSWLPS